jgi:hypothetical protein
MTPDEASSGQSAPRLSRILIVEGISGIGKSTLIDTLIRGYVAERPARKLRTLLHLTQAHTYGPLAVDEDRGTLTAQQNIVHLDAVVSMLEWNVRALTAERVPKFFAIVDTLYLTHCHRPGVLTWKDAAAIDRRLAMLGAKLLFLHASPSTLWERGILPRQNDQFITGYAKRKWGQTLEAIHRYFVGEQESMRATLPKTQLAHHVMDVDGDLSSYLDAAYQFWLS